MIKGAFKIFDDALLDESKNPQESQSMVDNCMCIEMCNII